MLGVPFQMLTSRSTCSLTRANTRRGRLMSRERQLILYTKKYWRYVVLLLYLAQLVVFFICVHVNLCPLHWLYCLHNQWHLCTYTCIYNYLHMYLYIHLYIYLYIILVYILVAYIYLSIYLLIRLTLLQVCCIDQAKLMSSCLYLKNSDGNWNNLGSGHIFIVFVQQKIITILVV